VDNSLRVEACLVDLVALLWRSLMAKFISELSSPGDDRRY